MNHIDSRQEAVRCRICAQTRQPLPALPLGKTAPLGKRPILQIRASLRCSIALAQAGGRPYFRPVRGAFGRCLLGRFLPKLGGAFGHRLSFALALLASPALAQTTHIAVGYTSGGDVSPAFVARDQGMFAKRGLDVTLTALAFGSVLPPALISGSLDIASPTAPVLLQAADNGIDLVAVSGGSVTEQRSKDHAVLTRMGLDLKTAHEFAGKRIGIAGRGGFFDLLFADWMRRNGIASNGYTVVELGQPQMSDALKNASVDAVVAAEPNVTHIVQGHTGHVALYIESQFPNNLPVIVWAAARDWVAKHHQAARAFADAIAEASAWSVDHRAQWQQVVAGYSHYPLPLVQEAAPPDLKPQLTAAELALWIPIMRGQGLLSGNVDTAKLLNW